MEIISIILIYIAVGKWYADNAWYPNTDKTDYYLKLFGWSVYLFHMFSLFCFVVGYMFLRATLIIKKKEISYDC